MACELYCSPDLQAHFRRSAFLPVPASSSSAFLSARVLISQSMSNCCLGGKAWLARRQHRGQQRPQRNISLNQARPPADKAVAEAHAAWDCFFRHVQRLESLSTLSLQRCGLGDRDIRSLSVSLQILPAGRLRCLRLNGNCVGLSGFRMLLTALTSRRMRLPALWLRGQRPALSESGAKGIVEEAFQDGLFAEVG